MPKKHNLMNVYNRFDITFMRGDGVYLYDLEGNAYLDAGSGIAVNSFGHCHPEIVQVLQEQSTQLWHISNLYTSDIQLEFARALCTHSFAETVFFTNSGAEAIECALKVARRYHHHHGNPHKKRVITFKDAFHGRTHLCISATGTQDKDGYGTMSPDFDLIPLGDLEILKETISEETAAILIEPILGEGGIQIIEAGYLNAIREICTQKDILLICDEVQAGMGRTGTLFSFEHHGITPDICTSAKGIGAGFPLGACLATDKASVGMVHGTHGSTYGGNPLGCAVGHKVLSLLMEDPFLTKVSETGAFLLEKMQILQKKYADKISFVRGKGLMIGIGFTNSFKARDIVQTLLENYLITIPAANNVVRLLPPLILSEAEAIKIYDIVDTTLEAL